MLKLSWATWTRTSLVVVAALSANACDAKNTGSSTTCPAGEERCNCYANNTCNAELICRSKICVSDEFDVGGGPNESSSGGATAVGMGGATAVGTGGATTVGMGGATSVGTGGATTVGMGGVATGGVTTATSPLAGGATTMGGQSGAGGTTVVAGPNLIKDGTFQAFDTYWNAILQEGDSGTYSHPPTAAAVCVNNTSTSSSLYYELSFTIGYPNSVADTFVIEPGATYTLTYTVSASYPISFQVKIGHSVSPWTQVYAVSSDLLSTSYQTFSHQFKSTSGDTSAGVAFNAVLDLYGKLCLQQVSLTKS
jgi:hypothetical protein